MGRGFVSGIVLTEQNDIIQVGAASYEVFSCDNIFVVKILYTFLMSVSALTRSNCLSTLVQFL